MTKKLMVLDAEGERMADITSTLTTDGYLVLDTDAEDGSVSVALDRKEVKELITMLLDQLMDMPAN